MTYDELVNNLRNYTEIDSNVFTDSVINTFITFAENKILRAIDLDVFKKEPDFDYDIDMIDAATEFCRVANVKGIAGQIWKKKRMILDFTTILGRVGMKNCCCFFLLVGISNLVLVLISVVLSFKHRPDRTESGQVLKRSCEYSKFEVNELVVYLNQDDAYPRKRRKVFI